VPSGAHLVTEKEERVVREKCDVAELLKAKGWSTWLAGDGESTAAAAAERHCWLRKGENRNAAGSRDLR
jgi:hypothetical protein